MVSPSGSRCALVFLEVNASRRERQFIRDIKLQHLQVVIARGKEVLADLALCHDFFEAVEKGAHAVDGRGLFIGGQPAFIVDGLAAGAFAGFLFGVLLFTIGVLKTILILIFVLIGYIIGKSRDDNLSIVEEINELFRGKR